MEPPARSDQPNLRTRSQRRMASASNPIMPRSRDRRRNTVPYHPYPSQRITRSEEPRGSIGILDGAQDAHIRGGTFYAIGPGSVVVNVDVSSRSPVSANTTRRGRVRHPNRTDTVPNWNPRSPLPTKSDPQIYRDHLYDKSRGVPLWIPGPTGPQSHRQEGITIGDVGIITDQGGFWFLFNIFAEAGSETNGGQVPEGFIPLHWARNGLSSAGGFCVYERDVDERKMYTDKSWVASTGVSGQTLTEPISWEFMTHSSEGAVLVMPSGASSKTLRKPGLLRRYLEGNLERWYQYVNHQLFQDIGNGDLHLVYGCDKASAWGIALFKHTEDEMEFGRKSIYLEPDLTARPGMYTWRSTSGGSGKAWPEEESRDSSAMDVEGDGREQSNTVVENQCLFIRTMNPKLGGDVWKRIMEDAISTDISGSTPRFFHNPFGTGGAGTTSQGGHSSSGDRFSRRPSNSMNTLAHDSQFTPMGLHPSERLNNLLLKKHPEASMVITNDDDWMTTVDWKGGLLASEDLLWFNDVKVENGAVYLERFTPTSSISLPRMRSTRKFRRHPQFYSGQGNLRLTSGRTVFKLRRQNLSPSMKRWTTQASCRNSKGNISLKHWLSDDFAALLEARYEQLPPRASEQKGKQRETESQPFQPESTDLVLLVMGSTGAGKSTFVNTVAGYDATEVSHDLQSCTQEVKAVVCDALAGRRVVVVDTPGFNDTNISDIDVFRLVAEWLKQTYENGVELSGVIFLHRISDNRLTKAALHLLDVFNSICGRQALKNAILVTTMWDDIEEEEGSRREEELHKRFWSSMLGQGARCARFLNTRESAREAVFLANHASHYPLLVQTEMVDRGIEISRTSAGQVVLGWLAELLDAILKRLDEISTKLRRAVKKGDIRQGSQLRAQLHDAETQKDNVGHVMHGYKVVPQIKIQADCTPTPLAQLPFLTESPLSIAYSSSTSSLTASSLPPWSSAPPTSEQNGTPVSRSNPIGRRTSSSDFELVDSLPTVVNPTCSHLAISSSSMPIQIAPSISSTESTLSSTLSTPSSGDSSTFGFTIRHPSDENIPSPELTVADSHYQDCPTTHLKVPGGVLQHKKSFLAQARSKILIVSKLRGGAVELSKPATGFTGATEKHQNLHTLHRK